MYWTKLLSSVVAGIAKFLSLASKGFHPARDTIELELNLKNQR